jgi:hypothetical protein
MTVPRLRMTDADQERYGGPEWLDPDAITEWLNDLDYTGLVEVERQVIADLAPAFPDEGVTLLWAYAQMVRRTRAATSLPMMRLKVWLALRAEGVDVALADFTPKVFAIASEPDDEAEEDADPPASTPESSGISIPPVDSPGSETSTSGSTPSLPAVTTT